MDLSKELEFAKALAREAGEIMKRYFRADDIGTVWKSDKTPVTAADVAINKLVIEKVTLQFPDYGVLGEEESVKKGSEWMWVCDPVDGTVPFSIGLPISTFSLALTQNGKPLLGVIYDPFCDRLYWAQKGQGAFMNDKQVHVSSGNLDKGYVGFDVWTLPKPPDDIHIPLPGLREALFSKGAKPITPVSAVICCALVASGELVGEIFAVKKPEDIAAVKVIVEEAGGKVTDLQGNYQRYDDWTNGAIISNGVVHDELLKIVEECVS